MGFLQRGFAYGNRRGFAVAEVGEGIEEQTEYNSGSIVYGTHRAKVGQRLGIPNRKVTKLAFVLSRINLAVGDVFFVIARTFDNVEYVKQRLCDASELVGTPEWYELEFSSPPTINDEVAIYVEYQGGDGENHILVHYQNTDIKANENLRYTTPVCWWEEDNWDCAYKYEYETMGAGAVVYSIEQLCQDGGEVFGDANVSRAGQKLTIVNRKITHLGFWVWKLGSPTGDITFGIRRVSDDSLICSKVWGDASGLPDSYLEATYEEVEFDTPPTINEEVRVYAEFGNGNATDKAALHIRTTDVKGNEHLTFYSEGIWSDALTDRDARYRMKNLLA
ncbi:hypothetical protein ES705_21031 [subsurface metagenome]